jgi:hypothetical protein
LAQSTGGIGETALTEISDKAPDASVFQPPKDYILSDGKTGRPRRAPSTVSIQAPGAPGMIISAQGNSIDVKMGKAPIGSSNFNIASSAPAASAPAPASAPSEAPTDPNELVPARPLASIVAKPSEYLSNLNRFTNKELRTYFNMYQDASPLGQASLGFNVVAPKDWNTIQTKVSKKTLDSIGTRYCQLAELDGSAPNTGIEVWFTRPAVSESASAREFFDKYCQSLSMKAVEVKDGGKRVDALVEYTAGKAGDMMARIAFLQVGRNIIWLSGCAPKSEYPKLSNVFCLAAGSFSPIGYAAPLSPDVGRKTLSGNVLE